MFLYLSIFLAVTFAILAVYSLVVDLFYRDRPPLRQWLDRELRNRQRERARKSAVIFKRDALVLPPGEANRPVVPSPSLSRRVEILIEQAGLFLSPGQFVAVCAVAGLLAAILSIVFVAPVVGVLAGLAGAAAPWLWLLARRRARQREMLRQLPRAFELMARIIRAGSSIPQALAAVVDQFDPPLATEFAYCQEQQRLGLLPEISFRELAQRSEFIELKIFAMALLIQQKTGGNLSELLDRLAALIRERVRLQGVLRAATAEGRLQAMVLVALPPILFVLLFVLHRSYAEILLDHYELLIGAAVSMAIGAAWIHRIVRFQF
jgi:tight adherence protein B